LFGRRSAQSIAQGCIPVSIIEQFKRHHRIAPANEVSKQRIETERTEAMTGA